MSSLQVRLFLTYLFIILVTLALATLSLILQIGGYREDISYGNLEDLGLLINSQANAEIRRNLDGGLEVTETAELVIALRSFFAEPRRVASDTSIALIDRDGRIIPDATASPIDQPIDGAIVRDLAQQPSVGMVGRDPRRCRLEVPDRPSLLCVTMPLDDEVLAALADTNVSAVVVARPPATLGESLGDLMPRLLFSGLIGVAAALVLGFAFSQSVAAPLRNIARAARSVARGNYRQRVPATGPREVRDLAANFNRMTGEVQRSQQTLRDFLANISHELKTPLTSIRGFSEAMLDGTIDDQDGIERSARIISDESNRVLRLVQELLDLSRIESGQVSMEQDTIEVQELFDHVNEVFALRAEEGGVALEFAANGVARITGDFDRLEQVMNNLLDNALRYTPKDGRVRVACRDLQPGTLQITVSDTGPGIPSHDLPHLFERFYRSKASDNGASRKGYGLGLAITRAIARAHGGEIWATSEPGQGTTFVLTLPTAGRGAPQAAAR